MQIAQNWQNCKKRQNFAFFAILPILRYLQIAQNCKNAKTLWRKYSIFRTIKYTFSFLKNSQFDVFFQENRTLERGQIGNILASFDKFSRFSWPPRFWQLSTYTLSPQGVIVKSSSIADLRFLTNSEINKKERNRLISYSKWNHYLVTQIKSNQFMREDFTN